MTKYSALDIDGLISLIYDYNVADCEIDEGNGDERHCNWICGDDR